MADMAVIQVDFFAEKLGKRAAMEVLVPQGRGPFPVLALLHGLSDDHTAWGRLTPLLRLARAYPMIVAMPDGSRSFYTNDGRPGGYAYEDHIVSDVLGFLDATFPTIPRREARGVGGLSMGGYGAMMLALRHPEAFSLVAAHSSAFYAGTGKMAGRTDYADYLAKAFPTGEYSCFALAEVYAAAGRAARVIRVGPGGDAALSDAALAIRFDCGTEDALLESNRAFHAHLEKLGAAHEYAEYPGGHNWDYWDEHIRQSLAFADAHFRAAAKTT